MQPGSVVADKYRIERVLGRGGMGLVVEATHLTLGSRVALKFLAEELANEPTAQARFMREARATAQLRSDHVCRIIDFGVEGRAPYIVMELLAGTDLARLSKLRNLDVASAAFYVVQACAGLAEAHAAGIVHRDLKPGNLFLTRREDGAPLIKVLDFGVAKAPVSDDEPRLTGTSSVVGSPGFMSPEQFRSSKSVDARTDVWALGVILYKLISGRLPFPGNGFAEAALAISRDPTPKLEGVPAAFAAVVARCLEKDPARRFANVEELAAALALFSVGAPPHAPDMDAAAADEAISGIGTRPDGEQAREPRSNVKTLLGTPSHAPPEPDAAPPRRAAGALSVPVVETVAGTMAETGVRTMRDELPPGMLVGEYRIERKIGQGGMGTVYLAVHPVIGKKTAIKVISAALGADPSAVQRFTQEARSVNQIGHPNIVDVFAFGNLADGRNYFVMEYLTGESLRERMMRAPLSLAESLQILDEVANALEAAHEKQIVHRDLKPDNVFLANVRGGYVHVKLLDFGIAKLAKGDGIAKTHTGELMGTPAYLAPEQARRGSVDVRADIYALGCLMFEMVTGQLPFWATSAMEVMLAHVSAPPPRASHVVPTVPPLLDDLIVRMMAKHPDDRPTLAHVRAVFAELVATGAVPIEPGTGATFRSDLVRRIGDVEAPSSVVRRVGDVEVPSSVVRRAAEPEPMSASVEMTPPPRGRGWIIVAAVAAVAMIAVVVVLATRTPPASKTVAIGSSHVESKPSTAPSGADAAIAPAGAPSTDAGSSVAVGSSIDAGATPQPFTIAVNVPAATVEVDGHAATMSNGAVTVSFSAGPHRVVARAPGRVTFDKTIDVEATGGELAIELLRTKTTSTPPKGTPPRTGSGTVDGNYTIDPFK